MDGDRALRVLSLVQELRLLSAAEAEEIRKSFEPGYPFASALALAESLHVHIKVDDTARIPQPRLLASGGVVENEKTGYVKLAFPGGLNVIFSSIPVSEDELRETPETRRARPFLDHVGIDLRRKTDDVRSAFDAAPERALALGWGHTPQGGEGRPVYCCHTQVEGKHWVYPTAGEGPFRTPIELALGPLVIEAGKSGCDLRPSDPRLGLPPVTCHAASGESVPYYQSGDLAKFGEIGQSRGELADKFFAWYGAVFAEGALTAREKSLIALAVAHSVQCPYCIDAYSHDAQKKGASVDQMTEAVHVAAAIRGGASLVHGVQMRNHVAGH